MVHAITSINLLMEQNKLRVHFSEEPKSCFVTDSYLKSETLAKVCHLIAQTLNSKEFGLDRGYKLNLLRNPELSKKSPRIRLEFGGPEIAKIIIKKDTLPLGIEVFAGSKLPTPSEFVETFSWPSCHGSTFKIIPLGGIPYQKIPYGSETKYPHYNHLWFDLTNFLMATHPLSPYITIEDFLMRAQILLNRFFDINKEFLKENYKSLHPNVMFQALSTTIKIAEDLKDTNMNHAKFVFRFRTIYSVSLSDVLQDINKMERLFLKGIEWNVNFAVSPEEELLPLLFKKTLKTHKLSEPLAAKPKGSYVIQKENAHYVISIKTGEEIIKRLRFTFDAQYNTVQLIISPTFFEAGYLKVEPLKLYRDVRLATLIRKWGGTTLITK